MLSNIQNSEYESETSYERVFDDGTGNGFWFPCFEDGKLKPDMSNDAMTNFNWCMENPDLFVRFNKIVSTTRRFRVPAHGRCSCGNEVYLQDEYYGACQCEKCGKWYSLSGQELLPPDQWGWDGTPMEEDW